MRSFGEDLVVMRFFLGVVCLWGFGKYVFFGWGENWGEDCKGEIVVKRIFCVEVDFGVIFLIFEFDFCFFGVFIKFFCIIMLE